MHAGELHGNTVREEVESINDQLVPVGLSGSGKSSLLQELRSALWSVSATDRISHPPVNGIELLWLESLN